MEGLGSYERDSALLEEDDDMEEKAFTLRRSKSGSIKETLLYPVKQSPSVQALDNLVAEADEASTGESVVVWRECVVQTPKNGRCMEARQCPTYEEKEKEWTLDIHFFIIF